MPSTHFPIKKEEEAMRTFLGLPEVFELSAVIERFSSTPSGVDTPQGVRVSEREQGSTGRQIGRAHV